MIDQFQARFQFTDQDGRLTMEAYRFLRGWFERIGGYSGSSAEDAVLLASFVSAPDVSAMNAIEDIQSTQTSDKSAEIYEMRKVIDDLQNQISSLASTASISAEMSKRIDDLQLSLESIAQSTPVSEADKYAQYLEVSYSFNIDRSLYFEKRMQDIESQIASIPAPVPATVAAALGTMSTQNANAVAITGGTLTGMTSYSGGTGAFSTLSATGQITSTLAIGTSPFAITSTTVVPNLNASSLSGATFSAPGAIGGGTASSGAFTTISATSLATLSKGSSSGLTIGDVATNSNSVLRMQGTSAGNNWQMANNLNFGGLEFTPSTAAGGTTYTTPVFTLSTTAAVVTGTLKSTGAFGCNSKSAQTAFSLGAACTDLATAITLANNLRTMSINNGMGS